MEGRKPVTDDERRSVVAALLEAAAVVNGGGDPGDALRSMFARVKALRPSDGPPTPSTPGTSLAVVPKPLPVEVKREASQESIDAMAVFAYWRRQTGRTENTKPTSDRLGKIRTRLREGYTVEDMKRAIDGCMASPHHRGENESGMAYTDLTLILRTGSKLEFFRDMAPDDDVRLPDPKPVDPMKAKAKAETEALRERANELLAKGDTEGYANAIRAIKQRDAARR